MIGLKRDSAKQARRCWSREAWLRRGTERQARLMRTTPVTDEELMSIASSAVRQGDRFEFRSSSSDKTYFTTAISCTCPHWQYRGTPCRHMKAVAFLCPVPAGFQEDAFRGF